jgi:hypothetical protein
MKMFTLTEQQMNTLLEQLQEVPAKYVYNALTMLANILKEQNKPKEKAKKKKDEKAGQPGHSRDSKHI